MEKRIDIVRQAGRKMMRVVARGLNTATGGKLSPNAVTLAGVAMHLPIAVFIAQGDWIPAAVLLLVFGLFDTLDGDLARLQGRESANGMLLDSVTDRVKEVILYGGVAYYFALNDVHVWFAVAVATALGCSLLTSYLNAIGDAAVAKYNIKSQGHVVNRAFRGGLFPFEIRMLLLILGLLAGYLTVAVVVIALGAAYTAFARFAVVYSKLAGH
jgi:CDP-diacylglycerol--glycerol-3-phosphate 3-phosphatidyltransferase